VTKVPITQKEFLSILWGEDNHGVAELMTLDENGRTPGYPYSYPSELDKLIEDANRFSGKVHVFMGVCLRREKWKTGSRGTKKNTLSSMCVWADIDFKETPREEALKKIKEFPLKPSIVVKSGGGVHLYWLLKEPAVGTDLESRIEGINKVFVNILGADRQSIDLARVLRIPGTLNLKKEYDPPRLCEISLPGWNPNLRYTLDNFDDFSPEVKPIQVPSQEILVRKGPPSEDLKPFPPKDIPENIKSEIADHLSNLWKKGHRHNLALYVAGMFAHAGIKIETAKEIVKIASDAYGEKSEFRLRDVEATYKRFQEGTPIGGKGKIEDLFKDDPEAKKIWDIVKELSPKIDTDGPPADMEIITVNKPSETLQVDIGTLEVSESVRQIIRGGVPLYVEYRRQTDSPSKFIQQQEAEEMDNEEADAFVSVSLLQGGIKDEIIYSVFRNHPSGCGEKYATAGKDGDDYLRNTIIQSKKLIRAQPNWSASTICKAVARKTRKDHEDERLKILLVTKYNQEPPTYEVLISLHGKEYATRCSLDQAYYYDVFKKAFFAKHDLYLPPQRQSTWVRIYEKAKKETKEVEEQEATIGGQINAAIEDLVRSAIGEKSGISGVNHMAVKTDDGDIIFKTPVLLRYLKSQGLELKRNDVIHHLKESGWKGRSHRFGQEVIWIWAKVHQNEKEEEAGLFLQEKL